MTEDEAKTKWCPMARLDYDHSTINRDTEYKSEELVIPKASLCIGSDCMMWAADPSGFFGDNGHCGLCNMDQRMVRVEDD